MAQLSIQLDISEILALIEQLSMVERALVRDHLNLPQKGILGADLLARARAANFPSSDLEEMAAAIAEDCEQINPDDWQ